MTAMQTERHPGRIPRLIARIWTIPVFIIAVLVALPSDEPLAGPILPRDWLVLGLWALAVLGLLLAWRWERVGAWLTIGCLVAREVGWWLLFNEWVPSFMLVWAALLIPAVLFLWAGRMRANQHTSHS